MLSHLPGVGRELGRNACAQKAAQLASLSSTCSPVMTRKKHTSVEPTRQGKGPPGGKSPKFTRQTHLPPKKISAYLQSYHLAFQVALVVKNPPANAGDTGLIPGLGRSPGEGHGNPLQYSCLDNPMDRRTWQATIHRIAKSRTRLKGLSTTTGLEKVSFHSNPKERQCQRMLKLPHNCTHLTC